VLEADADDDCAYRHGNPCELEVNRPVVCSWCDRPATHTATSAGRKEIGCYAHIRLYFVNYARIAPAAPFARKLEVTERDLDDAIFLAERYGEDLVFAPEPYCDYCERDGHTFSSCPARDDEYGDDVEA
jgi:hypothetical protein